MGLEFNQKKKYKFPKVDIENFGDWLNLNFHFLEEVTTYGHYIFSFHYNKIFEDAWDMSLEGLDKRLSFSHNYCIQVQIFVSI